MGRCRPLVTGAIAVLAALPIGCSSSQPRLSSTGVGTGPGTSSTSARISLAAAPSGRAASGVPSGCIKMGIAGHQVWHGGPSAAASKLADALQQLADENQNEVSGVAFCTDYSGIVIFVASPSSELLSSIASAQRAYPRVPVYTATVAAALTAQLAAARRVVAAVNKKVSEVGPDSYTGGLSVSLLPQVPSSDQLRHQIIAAATANGSVRMPVTFLPSSSFSPDNSTGH